jgi:hypothetical protein
MFFFHIQVSWLALASVGGGGFALNSHSGAASGLKLTPMGERFAPKLAKSLEVVQQLVQHKNRPLA